MSEIEYRQRLARRIGIALAILGILSLLMAAVTSCFSTRRELPKDFPNGISLERWMIENTQTEIPKLTEP